MYSLHDLFAFLARYSKHLLHKPTSSLHTHLDLYAHSLPTTQHALTQTHTCTHILTHKHSHSHMRCCCASCHCTSFLVFNPLSGPLCKELQPRATVDDVFPPPLHKVKGCLGEDSNSCIFLSNRSYRQLFQAMELFLLLSALLCITSIENWNRNVNDIYEVMFERKEAKIKIVMMVL
jgi:hypothetical protein